MSRDRRPRRVHPAHEEIPPDRCSMCGILARNRSRIVVDPDTLTCDHCRTEAARGAKMTGEEWIW